MAHPDELLATWLQRRLPPAAESWLSDQCRTVADADPRSWSIAFALTPRRLGHTALDLSADELAQARRARPGWDPVDLDTADAGRLRLLLSLPSAQLPERLDGILATADLAETRLVYRGLPLYPGPERFRDRAIEGLRSNVVDSFAAIAHRNPYPAEQFPETAWNQMVLKALFVGLDLHPIQDFDRRTNPALATMLADYARERRAAGRPVHPELWRGVGPTADEAAVELLGTVLTEDDEPGRDAAALALAACPDPRAAEFLARDPNRRERITAGKLRW